MELVGLGLPLQGPGLTDYACVRGYVGVQVKSERHCVHVAPLDILERAIVHVFATPASLICYQAPGPNHTHPFIKHH